MIMMVPKGFLFSGVSSGIKKSGELDTGLIYLPDAGDCITYITNNKVKAAPLLVNLKKMKASKGKVKAVLVNSGNANCFTGSQGIKDAELTTKRLSEILKIRASAVLVSSTGIIGKRLPVKSMADRFPELTNGLNKKPDKFAKSILTTDTFKKVASKQIKCAGETINILGIAKGAGMIYPQLRHATMLAFICTDAHIKKSLLREAVSDAVEGSFNSITIDGYTSTNDSVFVASSNKAGGCYIKEKGRIFNLLGKALQEVCLKLAKMIVKDGEGVSKFIQIKIKGAKSKPEAKRAAYAVANSYLFKSAVYGQQKNWGRIVQILGQIGIPVSDNINVKASSLRRKEIDIDIDLKRGKAEFVVFTSDITPEYIKINAGYS